MAQHFTDFSEYPSGVQPSDWTDRWVISGSWTVEGIYDAVGAMVGSDPALAGLDVPLPPGLGSGQLEVCVFYSARQGTGATVVISTTDGNPWTEIYNVHSENNGLLAIWVREWQPGDVDPHLEGELGAYTSSGPTQRAFIFAVECGAMADPIGTVGTRFDEGNNNKGPVAGLSLPAGDAVVVLGALRNTISEVRTLSGDGLAWTEIIEGSTSGGSNGAAWANIAINDTGSAVTITDKTFSGSFGSGRFTGIMFTIKAATGFFGKNVLRFSRGGSTGRTILSWNEIDADADRDDVEILTRWRSTREVGSATGGLFGRGSGATAVESCYHGFQWGTTGTGPVSSNHIRKYVGGVLTQALVTNAEAWDANTWYYQRFRINGNALKFRRWSGTLGDEPGTWDLETTDTDVVGAGWVGVFEGEQSLSSDWDFIGVGTNGDAAPSSAVGGLTAVGKEITASWNDRAAVAQTRQTIFGVRASIAQTRELIYGVKAVTGQSRQAVWNTRALIADTVEARWGVRALVSRDRQVVWNVAGIIVVSRDVQLVWSVRGAVGQSRQMRWASRALVTDELTMPWNTRTAVAKVTELVWALRALMGLPVTVRWHTRQVVGGQVEVVWNVLVQVAPGLHVVVTEIVTPFNADGDHFARHTVDGEVIRRFDLEAESLLP